MRFCSSTILSLNRFISFKMDRSNCIELKNHADRYLNFCCFKLKNTDQSIAEFEKNPVEMFRDFHFPHIKNKQLGEV